MSRNSRSSSNNGSQSIENDFLFSVVAVRNYAPSSPMELSLEEKQVLHVLEDRDLFYFCYSPTTKQKGFVPKNYLQKKKPLTVIAGHCIVDFMPSSELEMLCKEGDRILAVAKCDSDYLLCKNLTRVSNSGRVPRLYLNLEGDPDNLLPVDEYRDRSSSTNYDSPIQSRSRSNTNPSLSKPASEREVKSLERLINRPRATSVGKMLQLLSPPKDY
eukprot:NODE_93_length_21530_cov_0.700387.p12 type:complete len:215 gc:universal NODE_93_length_21530_cov_0.700387:5416-6060(+)